MRILLATDGLPDALASARFAGALARRTGADLLLLYVAWVPGAFMVYRQPDPDIRARILDYLEHPSGGGEKARRARAMSSAAIDR